jgi:hypothetical protein
MTNDARPALRRAEVLDCDEALYVCIEAQIRLDDLYTSLLDHDEPHELSFTIEEFVRDGGWAVQTQHGKEEH